jgi:hypothetical protein
MKKSVILGASAPSAIRSAVFLTDLLSINLDLAPVFDLLIETVRNLVEITENPLRTKPFDLYDSLLSLSSIPHEIESDLTGLLQQFAFTANILEDKPSLLRLGIIFEIIFLANPAYVVSTEIQEQIQAYLQQFWTGDGFLADIMDEIPNPIATYFGFTIRKRSGLLQPEDLSWFFHYFVVAFEHAIRNIDYAIPETVATVLFCKKFFNAFEIEPNFQPFGFPPNSSCLFLEPFIKELLGCPSPVGGDIIPFSDAEKIQKEFLVNRQVVAQEVTQLLREPRVPLKNPEVPSQPAVAVDPFSSQNPTELAKHDGIIVQNHNWEESFQEMDATVGELGKVLNTVNIPRRGTVVQGAAENSTRGSIEPSFTKIEKENQEIPASYRKNDAGIRKSKKDLLQEELALNARREILTEWLTSNLPDATKLEMETCVEEILTMEKTHQLDTYLDFLRRVKGVDTSRFPAAK